MTPAKKLPNPSNDTRDKASDTVSFILILANDFPSFLLLRKAFVTAVSFRLVQGAHQSVSLESRSRFQL